MTRRGVWTLYYLVALATEAVVFGLLAHQLKPLESLSYSFLLGTIVTLVLLVPFYILTWIGTKNPEPNVKRAFGTGFLIWSFIITAHVVVGLLGLGSISRWLVYACDVLIGFFLLWYFRLPYAFSILAIIFPGLSLLYFLIYGQLQQDKR